MRSIGCVGVAMLAADCGSRRRRRCRSTWSWCSRSTSRARWTARSRSCSGAAMSQAFQHPEVLAGDPRRPLWPDRGHLCRVGRARVAGGRRALDADRGRRHRRGFRGRPRRGAAVRVFAAPRSRARSPSPPPLFDGNGFDGLRQVIDVSGDGPNNMGPPVEPVRDAVLARGHHHQRPADHAQRRRFSGYCESASSTSTTRTA